MIDFRRLNGNDFSGKFWKKLKIPSFFATIYAIAKIWQISADWISILFKIQERAAVILQKIKLNNQAMIIRDIGTKFGCDTQNIIWKKTASDYWNIELKNVTKSPFSSYTFCTLCQNTQEALQMQKDRVTRFVTRNNKSDLQTRSLKVIRTRAIISY